MSAAFPQFDERDDDACRLQATVLMRKALALLDHAGEARAAVHLQHAIDVLALRLPEVGLRH